MLVVGEKEMSEEKVAIRRHGKGDAGVKTIVEFIADAVAEIKDKRAE
jgi:threonyl-tRNA synthetase